MRIFFTILGIAGGVVLLVLLGVTIAVFTVDPGDFVGPIQERVKEATGRDLAIGGGIELELGLEPKLVLRDVRIGNAPWGKAADLVAAKRVEAQVALLPLLRRRFDLVRLDLKEPVIALETDERGRGNWEFGPGPDRAREAKNAEAKDAPAPGSFFVGNLAIENGTLSYRDGTTGSVTRVDIDALSLVARDPSSAVNAEFRGRIDDVAVALTGSLGPLETLAQRGLPYPIAVRGEVAGRKAALATEVRRAEGVVELRDLEVTTGQSTAKGQVDIRDEGRRSRMSVKLSSPSLSVDDLPLTSAPAPAPAPEPAVDERKAPARYLFEEAAVPLAGLRANDIDGELAVDRLLLPAGRSFDGVRMRFELRDGKLVVSSFQAALFGGTVNGAVTVDASLGREPAIRVQLEGRELDLAALLAASGVPREVRGGKTQVAVDVAVRGDSPREWVSAMSGSVRAIVGPAALVNTGLDASLPFDRLIEAVNPFRSVDASTELECAVVRLPIERGVARIDHSIALETRKIGATATGTLDFRTETIDLAIKPRIKEGIPLDIAQIADLVRVRGTFLAPVVGVDAMASAAAAARIGAAIGTAGWSEVGKSLLAGGAGGPSNACDIALGRASAAATAPRSTQPTTPRTDRAPADEIGRALGRLLGK